MTLGCTTCHDSIDWAETSFDHGVTGFSLSGPHELREGDRLLLRVTSDVRPRQVSAWVAGSPTRDFRKARWKSHATQRDGGAYVYPLDVPAEGFAAMFGEAMYDGALMPYYLSTNVRIVRRAEKQ